ncbi:MAG: response regulator transcription factor [Candidatus Nanopelagicales bacterium]
MVSVMVCDDSPSVRAAVRRCLAAIPEVSVISTAASGEELLARYPVERPDVILLDVQMPGMGGCEALRRLHDHDRRVSVLMLTSGEAPGLVAESVSQGALGYLAKDASPQELAAALAVISGDEPHGTGLPHQRQSADPGLTEREQQVLRGMSEGLSNSQIGKELFLSEDTVKTHARRLFRKLSVSDRGHAVAEGFRRGLIS